MTGVCGGGGEGGDDRCVCVWGGRDDDDWCVCVCGGAWRWGSGAGEGNRVCRPARLGPLQGVKDRGSGRGGVRGVRGLGE